MERLLLTSIGANAIREHYLSTTFLAVSVFLLALSIKTEGFSVLSDIGKKDCLYIYIFHIVVASGISIAVVRLPDFLGLGYSYMAPLVVFLTTILLIVLLRKMRVIKR